MTPQQILQAKALDIIFDGRNKNYGAYELRANYESRIGKALAVTITICFLFILLQSIASKAKEKPVIQIGPTVELEDYKQKKDESIEIEKQQQPQKELIKQIVFSTILITNTEIPQEEVPPTIEEINNTQIGTIAVDGKDGGDIIAPPIESKSIGNAQGVLPKEEDYEGVFKTVQIEASFVGGAAAWKKFLERNVDSDLPSNNGAIPGKYSVVVSFIVDKYGNVSDIKSETDPGYGTAAEAIRIIEKSPLWNPANQNGRAVAYRARQVITFIVND
jgi:periplasmic protein TonB